jgi:hypothetical protein
VVVRGSGLIALLLMPVVATNALAGSIVKLASPAQEPEPRPQRPVGAPDSPPSIGLDFFAAELDGKTSREEAWPWPIDPDGD